jgi:Coenzyme PQQ synthesis protein D (PqqD)
VPRVKPRARAELAVAEIDGEAVVSDPVPGQLHYLNHSAALVFGLCDGRTTIAEMAEAIGDAYEMDVRELDGQIRPLLRQLKDAGLLEGKAAEQIVLDARKRKAALKKLRRIPVPKDT